MIRAITLVALATAGCANTDQIGEPLPAGDLASFEATVQPMATDSCGTLDCHGVPGRPLRIYAERGLRLSADLRGEPITEGEISLNAEAFLAVSPGLVDDHLALLKPLAIAAGGMEHVGRDLWDSTDHPDYAALHAWLASPTRRSSSR